MVTMVHSDRLVLVNRLSRILGERRLSVQEVARGAGLSYRVVLDLYHDRSTRLDVQTLNKLCDFLSVGPEQIFEWTPPERPDTAAPQGV
jgi:putative transcriptional regulator